MEELRQQEEDHKDYNYDITINTNGDAAPYYHPTFSKDNAITYCHFPSTKYHIESENIDYLKTDLGMAQSSNGSKKLKTKPQSRSRKECFEIINYGYSNLMQNSTVITNSQFSRKAIINALGLDNVYILNPPIDVETFRNHSSSVNNNNRRNGIILVIARIAPHKELENAIKLAKI